MTKALRTLLATAFLGSTAALSAAVFTVTNTNDSGFGSLRQAILDANGNDGVDLIAFDIPGTGVHTITPTSALPHVVDAVTIDGYTQPGARPNTQWTSDDAVLLIEIDGEAAGDDNGLVTGSPEGGVRIRGLVVNRFQTNFALSEGASLEGCFIGTDQTGAVARSRPDAVGVSASALGDVTIGGFLVSQRNVISGNGGPGISTRSARIWGNFIGINAAGTAALPNSINVDVLRGGSATIGGPATPVGSPPGNVISGGTSNGIRIVSLPDSFVLIQGNLIGTDASGTAAVPNGSDGILILPDVELLSSGRTLIGGSFPDDAGNVIAFNMGNGVRLGPASEAFCAVLSNSIHSNADLGFDREPFAGTGTPVLTVANSSGGFTTIQGTVEGSGYPRIELFSSPSCDPSEYGEGETLLGSTNANGGRFSVVFPLSLAVGSVVTATATSQSVNTTGFSACRQVTSEAPLAVASIAPTSGDAGGGTPLVVRGTGFLPGATVTVGGIPARDVVVVASSEIDATTPTLSAGTLNDVAVINPASAEGQSLQAAALASAWLADFRDVSQEDGFHDFVENIFRRGITAGYGNGDFGIHDAVTRAQMAVFLLKGEHGVDYVPPPCSGAFADVACTPTPDFAADWIEQLYREGVTGGCLPPGNYCPNQPTRRDEMAVLLLKSSHGNAYVPPPCTGVFGDVACTPPEDFAVDWIEDLYDRGITGGCSTDPRLYCPGQVNTRGEMAVFLVRTFPLP